MADSNTPIEPQEILDAYVDSLTSEQEHAREALVFGMVRFDALCDGQTPLPITSQDEYAAVASLLQEVDRKSKLLDQERKLTVTPLNDEVKRINDWYRPALDCFKKIRAAAETVMGAWVLHQRREEQRLLKEAEAAARARLEASVPAEALAGAAAAVVLVKEAVSKTPPKVQGLSHKPVWSWAWKEPNGEREFVISMAKRVAAGGVGAEVALSFLSPNLKEIGKYVSEHGAESGDKGALPGVIIQEDVRFTNRSK